MIKILKAGKIPVKKNYIYKIKCNNCGCVFECSENDFTRTKEMTKSWQPYHSGIFCLKTIECPCCKTKMEFDDLSTLPHREDFGDNIE